MNKIISETKSSSKRLTDYIEAIQLGNNIDDLIKEAFAKGDPRLIHLMVAAVAEADPDKIYNTLTAVFGNTTDREYLSAAITAVVENANARYRRQDATEGERKVAEKLILDARRVIAENASARMNIPDRPQLP